MREREKDIYVNLNIHTYIIQNSTRLFEHIRLGLDAILHIHKAVLRSDTSREARKVSISVASQTTHNHGTAGRTWALLSCDILYIVGDEALSNDLRRCHAAVNCGVYDAAPNKSDAVDLVFHKKRGGRTEWACICICMCIRLSECE